MTREEALKVLSEVETVEGGKFTLGRVSMDAINEAKKALAESVSMVHCSGCKHWKDDFQFCSPDINHCEIGNYMTGKNGYCLFGEK